MKEVAVSKRDLILEQIAEIVQGFSEEERVALLLFMDYCKVHKIGLETDLAKRTILSALRAARDDGYTLDDYDGFLIHILMACDNEFKK